MYLSHATYLKMAVEEGFRGRREGGPEEGGVLVLDGMVVGRGRRTAVRSGEHAFAACMREAGPLSMPELARTALYLGRAPCPDCWAAIIHNHIPLLVLPAEGPSGECSASEPELIHILLEDEGRGTRWRHLPGGVCTTDNHGNH